MCLPHRLRRTVGSESPSGWIFRAGKVQNFPASFSSSELSAHQMAPGGVIPHWRSRRALQLLSLHMRPSRLLVLIDLSKSSTALPVLSSTGQLGWFPYRSSCHGCCGSSM